MTIYEGILDICLMISLLVDIGANVSSSKQRRKLNKSIHEFHEEMLEYIDNNDKLNDYLKREIAAIDTKHNLKSDNLWRGLIMCAREVGHIKNGK